MDTKKNKLVKQLRKNFLKEPRHLIRYKKYLETKDQSLLQQLNEDFSNYVNYTILLSLIQTNIKFKSLHVRERMQDLNKEVISEDSLEYLVNQKRAYQLDLPPKKWEFIFEDGHLIEAMTKLTSREEQVLWLLFVEEIPSIEVQKALDISQQAVSKTKKRALSKLEIFMKEEGLNG
jgi:RNA polymerase sigma factor (sigma-70 family)